MTVKPSSLRSAANVKVSAQQTILLITFTQLNSSNLQDGKEMPQKEVSMNSCDVNVMCVKRDSRMLRAAYTSTYTYIQLLSNSARRIISRA